MWEREPSLADEDREMGKTATSGPRERNGKGGYWWTKTEKWRGPLVDKSRDVGKGATWTKRERNGKEAH